MHINRRITAATAGALVAIGLGSGLAACSSGPSTPPNATQILQSDGYTPSATWTSSLQSGLGDTSEVTSSQAGTDSAGNIQAVIVFDNASDASTGASGVQALAGGEGITVAANGDVVTATGSLSAWAAAGQDAGSTGFYTGN